MKSDASIHGLYSDLSNALRSADDLRLDVVAAHIATAIDCLVQDGQGFTREQILKQDDD